MNIYEKNEESVMNDAELEIEMYDARRLQEIFGISRCTAYAMMHMQGFPMIRIKRRLYVEKSKLREWLNSKSGKDFSEEFYYGRYQ